ncbi:hypothetical protein [uncultured Dokdonia sp.]|uniref:hypothetical protein n=1 Tax=Dokdonia sp. R78006 TaxID=3093866 RepID=UPI00260978EA|nr:hypothetical protein [uncultured Dokdonia sp.]
MKNIYIILLLFGTFSCNTEKDKVDNNFISGEWVYRSMHNIADEKIPFCEQDSTDCKNNLEFATAIMRLNSKNGIINGELDMGQWGKLKMTGKFNSSTNFELSGNGIPNTSTQGWVYDYNGYTIPDWQYGINQKDALVGSVIRSTDHGTSLKGKVASFYMVKK